MQRPLSLIAVETLEALADLARRSPPGSIVEVGVYQGGSAWYLAEVAREQQRPLFLYDTFKGIPHRCDDDPHRIGDFADTNIDTVRRWIPDAIIVKGTFPESAIEMPPIGFVHLDCDQYQSVRDSILYLAPRMMPGGVIWFDDYGCLPGANKAVDELCVNLRLSRRGGKRYIVVGSRST